MEAYAGIDLHLSSNFTAVIDETDRKVYGKQLANRLDAVLSALSPFKENLLGWMLDGGRTKLRI